MAYTRHGHLIPGTNSAEPKSEPGRARCGGPNLCEQCHHDVIAYRGRFAMLVQGPEAGGEVMAHQNKIAVYANADYEGVPFRLLLGLATVKNGQVIFERYDLNPAIVGPRGELYNAPVEPIQEEATVTHLDEWIRTRRPWEENNE